MKNYDILIASDHRGFLLKNKIIDYIQNKSSSIYDFGPNNSENKVDYPDYAKKVVDGILENIAPFGILICDTGIGMSIAAYRSSGIRAAICFDLFMAKRVRAHNNANILVFGANIFNDTLIYEMINIFLTTKFEGGRHDTRLSKLN